MTELYHYTECGLNNIYLSNGVRFREGRRGTVVQIENIEELHRAIGHYLATQKKHLDGRESRFLRHEMGLSQAQLAFLLGKDEQSVARWEKKRLAKEQVIPPDSERVIRLLYLEMSGNTKVRQFLQELAELDDLDGHPISFVPSDDGWEPAAA